MSWLLDGVREAAGKPDSAQHGRNVRDAKLAVWRELYARWGADALLRHLPAISAVIEWSVREAEAMMNIGIGCDECEGRGYSYIGQDNGVDDTIYYPCPNCSAPDVPERDYVDSNEDEAMAETEGRLM